MVHAPEEWWDTGRGASPGRGGPPGEGGCKEDMGRVHRGETHHPDGGEVDGQDHVDRGVPVAQGGEHLQHCTGVTQFLPRS